MEELSAQPPTARPTAPQPLPNSYAGDVNGHDGPPSAGRVLVVDDDEAVRVLLTRYLEIEGFSVDEISAITDRKPEQVHQSIHHAREKLRHSFPINNPFKDRLLQQT